MGRLNTYLVKKASVAIGGLIVFACCVLLLERLLRIFEIVTNSTNPGGDASRMIINLLPHYLGMAVPMALMLGTIITIDRFSRTTELTAALGAGVSLTHMTKPFLWIAALLAVATVFIEGWLQPIGRYNYREVVSTVRQQSFSAALREGTFTTVGNRTFFAGTSGEDGAIGPIFIYERVVDMPETASEDMEEQIGFRFTTATEGALIVREETQAPVLQLARGRGYQVLRKDGTDGRLNVDLTFEESYNSRPANVIPFRVRGDDERELTSYELFENRKGDRRDEIDRNTNNAALHLRAARILLLFILPFIAVPFGLNYGRNPSSAGIFVGVVFLVSLQKGLEFAQNLGASGKLPPWLGIWGLMAALAIFAFVIFRKSAFKMGQPPLTSFAQWITHMRKQITAQIGQLRSRLSGVDRHA